MILRKLRKDRKLSQEQLAIMSGLSVRTIQRIENGNREYIWDRHLKSKLLILKTIKFRFS